MDGVIGAVRHQIETAQADVTKQPVVRGFFHESSNTISYVVHDPVSLTGAVIDPVLDYDPAAGRISTASADGIRDYISDTGIKVAWLLETHVHADHLSAAHYLRENIGGKIAIGRGIMAVQKIFAPIFDAGPDFPCDGSQFDRLLDDGDVFSIGSQDGAALHLPGHTPADMAYIIGDAAFVGDTIFMPDYGTARTDFPGGDAGELYRSIRRLLSLPPTTRIFLCHDYGAPGRDSVAWETTVADERARNIHVHDGISEAEFVAMRENRDRDLAMPKLLLPSIQVNITAGKLPPAANNGIRYLRVPLNAI